MELRRLEDTRLLWLMTVDQRAERSVEGQKGNRTDVLKVRLEMGGVGAHGSQGREIWKLFPRRSVAGSQISKNEDGERMPKSMRSSC